MPITLQISKGILTERGEREVHPRMAQALLKAHGLIGNAFMTPLVIGHLKLTDAERTFVGGHNQSLAVIELKVPPGTFSSQTVLDQFVMEATDIVDELGTGTHPRARTFVNITHALEGSWGVSGRAYTSDQLGEAIGRGQPPKV
jgi:hypothetical protein